MQDVKKHYLITLIFILLFLFVGSNTVHSKGSSGYAANLVPKGEYVLAGEKHLIHDYPALTTGGNINVVVEIPTGTNAKWEVDKATGGLIWEFKKGKPRVVSYLGYPGNYGMIPSSSLPKELGGDGDPLDVLVIGQALPRGAVVEVRPIGVLKLLDGGEQDDKIIAVVPGSKMGKISSIEELDRKFKGITEIIEIWFSNYKGPGEIESKGYGGVAEARKMIQFASEAYGRSF